MFQFREITSEILGHGMDRNSGTDFDDCNRLLADGFHIESTLVAKP
jgi:hypothetical protein